MGQCRSYDLMQACYWAAAGIGHSVSSIVHSRRRQRKQSKPRVATAYSKEWTKRPVQCTHSIRTHVNLHSDFWHPCNGTHITWSLHDFILRAKEIHVHLFTMTLWSPRMDCSEEATGWTIGKSGFNSWRRQEVFLLHNVQASSETRRTPYPVRSGVVISPQR
jgi:hypothetical protein